MAILTFLFTILFVYRTCNFSWKKVLDTFILNNGIGYVWIIRIYLIVALLIPLCKKIVEKYSRTTTVIVTIFLYIIYEMLYYFGIFNNEIILYLFAYVIPCYSLIIFTYFIFENRKALLRVGTISFIFFIIVGFIVYKLSSVNTNSKISI